MARMVIVLGVVFGIVFFAAELLATFLNHHPWSALPAMLIFG
jgi:hypothetical protein